MINNKKIIEIKTDSIYPFDVFIKDSIYSLELYYKDKILEGFVLKGNNRDLIQYVILNINSLNVPKTLIEYYKTVPSVKFGVVTWSLAGGNASKNAISNRVSLPREWLEVMNIEKDDRDIKIIFDGERIIIEKK